MANKWIRIISASGSSRPYEVTPEQLEEFKYDVKRFRRHNFGLTLMHLRGSTTMSSNRFVDWEEV